MTTSSASISFQPELRSTFHPTSSSGIPICGRSQTASIRIAFVPRIPYIGIDWQRFLFGRTPRNCIGAVFARIEMQIHVMTIADTCGCDTFNRGRLSSKPV